jgi:hypothetical protein
LSDADTSKQATENDRRSEAEGKAHRVLSRTENCVQIIAAITEACPVT